MCVPNIYWDKSSKQRQNGHVLAYIASKHLKNKLYIKIMFLARWKFNFPIDMHD